MLDLCYDTGVKLRLAFNCGKSFWICFGEQCKQSIGDVHIGEVDFGWAMQIPYLSVCLCGGKIYVLILLKSGKLFSQPATEFMLMPSLTIILCICAARIKNFKLLLEQCT